METLPDEIEDFYEQCDFIMNKLKIAIKDEKIPVEIRNEAEKYRHAIKNLLAPMHDLSVGILRNTIYTVGRRPIGSLEYIEKHEISAWSRRHAKGLIANQFKEIDPIEFEVIGKKVSWEK